MQNEDGRQHSLCRGHTSGTPRLFSWSGGSTVSSFDRVLSTRTYTHVRARTHIPNVDSDCPKNSPWEPKTHLHTEKTGLNRTIPLFRVKSKTSTFGLIRETVNVYLYLIIYQVDPDLMTSLLFNNGSIYSHNDFWLNTSGPRRFCIDLRDNTNLLIFF